MLRKTVPLDAVPGIHKPSHTVIASQYLLSLLLDRQRGAETLESIWTGTRMWLARCSKFVFASTLFFQVACGLLSPKCSWILYLLKLWSWQGAGIMERKKSHYFSYYPIFLLYSPQSPCLPPSNYSQNEMILCLGFASAGEKMEAIDWP